MASKWTDFEIETLKCIFPTTSDSVVAKTLNRSLPATRIKARRLGLYKHSEYLEKIQKKNIENIASGPYRHQFNKNDPAIFRASGKNHPRYVADRSQIKHRKNRFSAIAMKAVRLGQEDKCNICREGLFQKGEFDHIIPVCIGGTGSIDNCQLLCKSCHIGKTSYEQEVSNNFLDLQRLQEQYTFIARTLI